MLTGESVPIEAGIGFETFAGALVRRGEAVAEAGRPEREPNLDAPPSWFGPRKSKAPSKKRFCA
jgi:hypothetical protein